jgi:threonine aldolase
MRAAIAGAAVGDEQRGEDPTVTALETRVAALLGQQAAVFLPSATMANQIALRVLGTPGDVILADEHCHMFISESGGPAVHGGLVMRPLQSRSGRFSASQVQAAASASPAIHRPPLRIVSIENTHNTSGGRVWPLAEIREIVDVCRDLQLSTHLDGARLFNAAVALGVAPAAIASNFDTVTVCLSKGLGCPIGALVAGTGESMLKARRLKHLFGGAMRQAGIIAAAGLYALDHHVERLADDHARARWLAEGLTEAGVRVELANVETNFVQINVGALGMEAGEALRRLSAEGVELSSTARPGLLRAVTHLGVDDGDIDLAVALISRALRQS